MAVPTKAEYEEALKRKTYLDDVVEREYKNREKLINQLCDIQGYLDSYKSLLNDVKEVIQKYEIYQEVLEESK